MQQARRTNPYPWTWEPFAAVLLTIPQTMVFALHIARTIANLFAGGGLRFTPLASLFRSIPGLLEGDATAGLPRSTVSHASGGALGFWIVVTELTVLVAVILISRWGLRRWGPGRIQGMASPREAEELLGISRLRRNAPVVRPDLYGKAERHGRH